uniref:Secreted protein n=1 Tax=Angiostrongylus cantonensis TaxID=6313 RepID=A0A0K0D8Y8_ANGCA
LRASIDDLRHFHARLYFALKVYVCTLFLLFKGNEYFRRRRSSTDDSDYAPYAGTGPGFKKNKVGYFFYIKINRNDIRLRGSCTSENHFPVSLRRSMSQLPVNLQ